jgi:hypothetical protein
MMAVAEREFSAQEYEEQLERDVADFQHDPYGYVLYAYDWGKGELVGFDGPDAWQTTVLKDISALLKAGLVKREDTWLFVADAIQLAVKSGHGVGKSALVAWILDWAMSTMEDTRGIVTANTDTQLRTKTWPEVAKWHRRSVTRHWFVLTATALYSADPEHEKTWRVDIIPWSENNTEAFAGLHNKGKRIIVIFDEASAIPETISEVTEGALTDSDTEILWFKFGNPTLTSGNFFDCFNKMRHRWKRYTVNAEQSRFTNKEKIGKWIEDKGYDSDFVRVRVRGEFPNAEAGQFIPADVVAAARGRKHRPDQFAKFPKIIGVDPKYSGADEFVIALRQGLSSKILAVIDKDTDNDELMAGIIARYEDEEQADAVFIDFGYGSGIYAFGKQMKRKWTLVPFGSASPERKYLNMRAFMWGSYKDWLKQGGALPDDEILCEETKAPHAYLTTGKDEGRLVLESKEDMKDRGVASPNRADAIALTFAFPVQKKASAMLANLAQRKEFANGKTGYSVLPTRR